MFALVTYQLSKLLESNMAHVTPVVLLLNYTNIIWYGNRGEHQYTYKDKNNINKTWSPYKTNESPVESNIIF